MKFVKLLTAAYVAGVLRHPHEGAIPVADAEAKRLVDSEVAEDATEGFSDEQIEEARGPIQVTGRANYRLYGRKIGIDLERRPELASAPSIGLHVSCAYWTDKRLNVLADADDIEAITRRINGGINGLADRRARLSAAKLLLA
jgi:predicted chitinase